MKKTCYYNTLNLLICCIYISRSCVCLMLASSSCSVMKWMFVLLHCILVSSYAAKIYYVLPYNSTNTSCPSEPCATFSHYLQQNNNSLPTLSNVEYRFLPGEHKITKMIVINANNFSLLGTANNSSAFAALQLFTDSVIFNDCTGISIARFVFEFCECTRCNSNGPAIYIISCVD